MANLRALDKRRKSIRNIRKITRTMELIATARFKKAMDRAAAATDYTDRITAIVRDLAKSGASVSHPLLESREKPQSADLIILTSNRGLCGGYNGSVVRVALQRRSELASELARNGIQVSGKRGISALRFRGVAIERTFTEFEDQPSFDAVAAIADQLMDRYIRGELDRVDIAYTKFLTISKQVAVVETLLPLGKLDAAQAPSDGPKEDYEFLPSASSILEEVVPASFRVRLFKCFLDAAVSEQISRMVAMKSATENAGDMIKSLSRTFNRARQAKITQEIMEIIGGVEALG
ncbi:MAG: ATP synthase F1 subunit gamma [Pirellulales bacterium]